MTPRGHRIAEMADDLCRGKRYEAADAHVKAGNDMERILGMQPKPDPFHDFLSGWDAAMETTFDDLNNENQELHGIITNLCARMAIERCPVCKGEMLTPENEPCTHCEQGFVDRPTTKGDGK
jgi:hypothetical protein